jgi:hypothetical protein
MDLPCDMTGSCVKDVMNDATYGTGCNLKGNSLAVKNGLAFCSFRDCEHAMALLEFTSPHPSSRETREW